MTNSLPESVIIVGASGFIGRNLVRALKPHVPQVVPVSVSGKNVEGLPGHCFRNLDDLKPAPDSVVIHVAAHRYDAANFVAAQTEILVRNAEIAGKVYAFCATNGIKEVRYASSSAVYPAGDAYLDDAAPLDLNSSPHPGELMYGWSKRIGEIYGILFAEKNGIHTLAFRLTNPYGPYDSIEESKAHVVPAFVIRALTSTGPFKVRGSPLASRDFIYIDDVCEVFRRSLVWRGRSAAYNLSSGTNTSIQQLAETVLNLTENKREIVALGAATSAAMHRHCPNDRLKLDFAISNFITLEEGLKPTIDWYRHVL